MTKTLVQEAQEQFESALVYRTMGRNDQAIFYFSSAAKTYWQASMPQQAGDACAEVLRLDPRNTWAVQAFRHARKTAAKPSVPRWLSVPSTSEPTHPARGGNAELAERIRQQMQTRKMAG